MSNERSQTGVLILLGVLALAVILLVLKGCHTHPPVADIPEPPPEPAQVSDSITINFYLDGSGSIMHFLKAPPAADSDGHPMANYMEKFLNAVGTTLSNPPGEGGWKDKHLSFWTFGGGKIVAMPGGDPRNMILDPSLFNAASTSIETPINERRPFERGEQRPELKIIVTDLYEENGRIEKPANILAAKYLSEPGSSQDSPVKADADAVGIIAVRNPFDGEVEDLPGTPPNGTLHHAANSMPFYVIVAGPTADVRHTIQVLLARTDLGDAMAKHLATEFFFSRTPAPRRRDEMTPEGGRGDKYMMQDADHLNRQIPLIELSKGKVEMSWHDSMHSESDGVKLFNEERLEPKVLASGDNTWVDAPYALDAIGSCSSGKLLCETVDRSKLARVPNTYILRFDREALQAAPVLEPSSPAVKEWNIEFSDAKAISQSASPAFPADEHAGEKAGKTPDLSKFLKALQGQMFHKPVTITSYYVYLQAN